MSNANVESGVVQQLVPGILAGSFPILQERNTDWVTCPLSAFGYPPGTPVPKGLEGRRLRYAIVKGNVVRLELKWCKESQKFVLFANGDFIATCSTKGRGERQRTWISFEGVDREAKVGETIEKKWVYGAQWTSTDGVEWREPLPLTRATQEKARPKGCGCTPATYVSNAKGDGDVEMHPVFLAFDGISYDVRTEPGYTRFLADAFPDKKLLPNLTTEGQTLHDGSNESTLVVEWPARMPAGGLVPLLPHRAEYKFVRSKDRSGKSKLEILGPMRADLFWSEDVLTKAVGFADDSGQSWDLHLVKNPPPGKTNNDPGAIKQVLFGATLVTPTNDEEATTGEGNSLVEVTHEEAAADSSNLVAVQ